MRSLFSVLLITCFISQATALSETVDQLTTSLKESFQNLTQKRDLWFENYSLLRRLSQEDHTQLQDLLFVSRAAIPMIWHLYTTQVKAQKDGLEGLTQPGPQPIPFEASLYFPHIPIFHLELTLLLHAEKNFQIEILRDRRQQVFLMGFDFNNRRAAVGDTAGQQQYTERGVLQGDHFPAITLNQPFRVNIQVADDCIFASILVGNLDLKTPMPLPQTIKWCTADYQTGKEFDIKVNYRSSDLIPVEAEFDSPENQQEAFDAEQDADDDHDYVVVISATSYNGLLIQ